MPSIRYYLFRAAMKPLGWSSRRFPADDPDSLVRLRQTAGRIADMFTRPPRWASVERSTVGNIAGEWVAVAGARSSPVMLFLHGGGLFFPWSNLFRRGLSYLARYSGLSAFAVDYRLPPEHVYPAAHDDCFAVYQTLVQQGRKVVLVGESSGGLLALATLLRAKRANLPQPQLCVLLSPVVDCGFKDLRGWEHEAFYVDPRFTIGIHKHYVAGNDTSIPDLSPVDANLADLAPIFSLAGEQDFARGEVERLADAAKRCALEMHYQLWPRAWHGWNLFVPHLPEATEAYKSLGAVIRQHSY